MSDLGNEKLYASICLYKEWLVLGNSNINSELPGRPSILIPEEVKTTVEVLNKFVNQNEVEKPVKRRPEPDKT